MPTYTIGQQLPNGATVVTDDVTVLDDGTVIERIVDSAGNEATSVNPPADVTVEQTVTVDPQALTDAQTAVSNATTVAQLRKAVVAALQLLNPT